MTEPIKPTDEIIPLALGTSPASEPTTEVPTTEGPTRRERTADEHARPQRRPDWLTVRAPGGETYAWLKDLMRSKELHTVCEEAMCPNISSCWGRGTATFLILGDVCTRSCGFCDIKTGRPGALDWAEPERLAQAVAAMRLQHVVITSVNRDERPDGGAPIFALCIRRVHALRPDCSVEVLIPDFKGSAEALAIVLLEQPEILNHNVETVPRLFRRVQPQDRYEWALQTLANAKRIDPDVVTKSGLMVGLGETFAEILAVMHDLRAIEVDVLTVGQYLQPSKQHLPIERYWRPEEFADLRQAGLEMGFRWVESAPLVRSSYHADQQADALSVRHRRTLARPA